MIDDLLVRLASGTRPVDEQVVRSFRRRRAIQPLFLLLLYQPIVLTFLHAAGLVVGEGLGAACLIAFLVGAVGIAVFWRCPDCKVSFGLRPRHLNALACPRCGASFA